MRKSCDQAKVVSGKVLLVDDQVQSWCSRVIQKLDQQFNENIGAYTDKSMAFKFEKIMQAVCRQLEQIIKEEDDEDRGFITAKDFMNDFATEEFVSKNIRVRPNSGVTRGGDNDETKTQGGGDNGLSRMGEANVDDEEKFNETVKFELEAERKLAKEKMKEFQKRKAMEEELLKKKKGGY